jgi:anti-anti-sigma factor
MGLGLQIQLEQIEDRLVVRLEGRLDAPSCPVLERKLTTLIEEKHRYLLLDFTSVDYLSSAGMRVLLHASKKLKEKKGFLLVFSASDEVAEIIRMAGFEKALHLTSNEKDALQYRP